VRKAKKILNDPKNVVSELLDGLVEANHGRIKKLDGVNALVRTNILAGKVGLLIGGGSGHEPMYHGFIGDNMADGAACGNIFAAPSPDIILEATRAVNQGKGVLYLYGNYAGDILNFDLGAEMAADEGIQVKTVLVRDDVASGALENRRGIGGALFAIKIAGGAAATADSLDEVYRLTSKALDNTRSIAIAVSAGSIPETGEFTFELPDDEVEIGMGAHGEPGVSREKMIAADKLVEKMMDEILSDLPLKKGDEVALLINDMGSTTMMELLIANRKTRQILRDKGIEVYDSVVGPIFTTQEMAGFSITLMKLDAELKKYYDLPIRSFGWTRW
jgi:dihydroxyacetone kinase-like protein